MDKSKQKSKKNTLQTIHIRVPASATNNMNSMQKITENVLGKLGCPNCHSGFDLRFDIERIFVFNENLELERSF